MIDRPNQATARNDRPMRAPNFTPEPQLKSTYFGQWLELEGLYWIAISAISVICD